jgi:hypothetical protein
MGQEDLLLTNSSRILPNVRDDSHDLAPRAVKLGATKVTTWSLFPTAD